MQPMQNVKESGGEQALIGRKAFSAAIFTVQS